MHHSPPKEGEGGVWLMLFVFNDGNGDLGTVFGTGPYSATRVLTGS